MALFDDPAGKPEGRREERRFGRLLTGRGALAAEAREKVDAFVSACSQMLLCTNRGFRPEASQFSPRRIPSTLCRIAELAMRLDRIAKQSDGHTGARD